MAVCWKTANERSTNRRCEGTLFVFNSTLIHPSPHLQSSLDSAGPTYRILDNYESRVPSQLVDSEFWTTQLKAQNPAPAFVCHWTMSLPPVIRHFRLARLGDPGDHETGDVEWQRIDARTNPAWTCGLPGHVEGTTLLR